MTRLGLILLGVAPALLATSCASLGDSLPAQEPGAAMRLTPTAASAPAPAGLARFCVGRTDCGAGDGAAQSAEATFRALLLARAEDHGADLTLPPVAILDRAAWRMLRRVNREVNGAIAPARDESGDRWTTPLSPGGDGAGDCEDYVLEKRARLLALGWPAQSLSIATANAPRWGAHAVLIAHTDRGDFVLDNLHVEPVAAAELDYAWLALQTGEDLRDWRGIVTAHR